MGLALKTLTQADSPCCQPLLDRKTAHRFWEERDLETEGVPGGCGVWLVHLELPPMASLRWFAQLAFFLPRRAGCSVAAFLPKS